MAKVFITGSSDGIGLEAAKQLLNEGHEVIFHARNKKTADELQDKISKKIKILIADLTNFDEVKRLALEVNSLGRFDSIIHNAGVLNSSAQDIFKVNVLAVYILTALIEKPKKLIYIGSNMHPQGDINIKTLSLESGVDYSTSKLMVLMLSLYLSNIWEDIGVYTVDPGWVKTKMANYNAPDSLKDGSETQVWLAKSNEDILGKYYFHHKQKEYSKKADDILMQENLLKTYEKITGVKIV